MNESFRRIAVSGSAAVALLGGVATLAVANAEPASATEIQSAVDRATGAAVKLPDGRTLHVPGMDAAAYRVDAGHYTAAVTLASAKTSIGSTGDITNGLTPDSGSALQNPFNTGQVPAGYGQQIQTQAGGGTISLTVAIGVALLAVVIVMVKKGHVKFAQAFACVALGVYLAPTFFGPLIQQLGGSAASGLGNVWAGF